MKQTYRGSVTLGFILMASAGPLFAQPYSFDENGNGTRDVALNPFPIQFQVAPDPTGGITTSPVLIYSLDANVFSGDLELVGPGNTIDGLLRFFTPAGASASDVIFYAPVNGTLAGVGIPSPDAPLVIQDTGRTTWSPGANQPGEGNGSFPVFDDFRYTIITGTPEPSTTALLLIAAVLWLTARGVRRSRCRI